MEPLIQKQNQRKNLPKKLLPARAESLRKARRSKIIIVLFLVLIISGGLIWWIINAGGASEIKDKIFKQEAKENSNLYFRENLINKDYSGGGLSVEEKIKEYKEAAGRLYDVLQVNPNDIESLEEIAGVYYNLAEYNKAINIYKRLIEISPDNALYYTNIANVYLAIGEKDLSKENYKKSISIDPNITINYINLIKIYKSEKDLDSINLLLEEYLKWTPDNNILKSIIDEIRE